MKGFDDIELKWGEDVYTVPAEKQMELILRVEDGLTRGKGGQASLVLSHIEGPPIALCCQVFADVLRYAGSQASDLDVFHAVHDDLRKGDGSLITYIQTRFMLILGLIDLGSLEDELPEAKEGQAAKKPRPRRRAS